MFQQRRNFFRALASEIYGIAVTIECSDELLSPTDAARFPEVDFHVYIVVNIGERGELV